jgi:hypothetical protein
MKRIASVLLGALLAATAVWSTATAAPKSPQRNLASLVSTTMSAFVQALNDKSMDRFAMRFVAFEDKPQKLELAYSKLYPHAEVFAQTGSFAPVVTELAGTDGRSGLLVRGYYPGKFRISYEMLFVLENNDLKLVEFAVNAKPTANLDA